MNPRTAWREPSSLYLHVPFCPIKCPYCDFVTHVGSDALIEPYVVALCAEIERLARSASATALDTVYIGGGTPSLLTPEQIHRVLTCVDRTFGLAPDAELSMEANPGTVNVASLAGYRAAGINRLSLGGQSMDDGELRRLGRNHRAEDIRLGVGLSRQAGFDNVSLDFIYGTPGQTAASWKRTLDQALQLAPEHLSLYSLIVEDGTPFARRQSAGTLPLPPDDDVVDMYHLACDRLRSQGYEHYEVANWSRRGRQCRHNLTYWRDEEFYAAGVGAHGYLRPVRFAHVRGTKRYIELISQGADAIASREHTGPFDERFESVVMPLRLLSEGFDVRCYAARFGDDFAHRYGSVVGELQDLGFLEVDGPILRLREDKVPLANEAWVRFLPDPAPVLGS